MNCRDVHQTTEDFFVQRVTVTDYGRDRFQFFANRLAGKKVLHVGCTDRPVYQPETNLHLHLSRCVGDLAGCDPDANGIEVLRSLCRGRYFLSLAEVRETFDVVLAPEVLEHTTNPGDFLAELFRIPAAEYVLTAPNFSYWTSAKYEGQIFQETVHPDHKAWYSPYTLLNTCRPHLRETDAVEMFFVGDRSMIGIWIERREA
jgi:hypothetical protein